MKKQTWTDPESEKKAVKAITSLKRYLDRRFITLEKNHDTLQSYPSGTLFRDDKENYFLKVKCRFEDLENLVANLFTGEVVHYGTCGLLTPIYGNEIRW